MRRFLAVGLAAVMLLTLTGTAFAAKGGNAGVTGGNGNNTATISLVEPLAASLGSWPSVGDSVSFAVSANVKASDVYSLWVANYCYQDGVAVYQQFVPVQSGTAGPFTLSWSGGAASCTAYVFLFPNTASPLSGGSLSYSVAG